MNITTKLVHPLLDFWLALKKAAKVIEMNKTGSWMGNKLIRYVSGFVLVLLATLLDFPFHTRISPTNLVMFYLLAVVVSAAFLGRGPAVLTSVVGVAAFDYFYVPPFNTLAIEDTEYLITFAGLLIVGITISELMVRIREQAEKVRQSRIIEETEKLQGALLNSISHDLRTPLVSITGSLSTLREKIITMDDELRINLIENAYHEAERLNRFVSNLLNMSRLEAGAMKIHKQPEDIQDAIGSALEQLNEQIGQRSVTMDIDPDLPLVQMDFVLIVQVLINVIENALKYSNGKAPVEIKASCNEKFVEIKISDHGIGIPTEDLQRVFDKFYRIQRPDNVSGTGLGLSICKGVIEAHQGNIFAENRPGGGTVITLTLPLEGAERR